MNLSNRTPIFIDTSAFIALANVRDQYHEDAVKLYNRLTSLGVPGFTSNFVVAETHALLIARAGQLLAKEWLFGLTLPIKRIDFEDEQQALDILRRYKESSFSVCDAYSFVLAERLGVSHVFTYDEHFREYGFIIFYRSTPVEKEPLCKIKPFYHYRHWGNTRV